jgi:hypothetical protein
MSWWALMPDGARVTVEGDETLRRTLATAQDELENLDQSESARLVQQRAAANAPKVSGRLARSVVAKDLGHGAVAVLSELIYAPVIHFGWAAHHISPQPFLTTALDDSAPIVEANSMRAANRILSHVRGA